MAETQQNIVDVTKFISNSKDFLLSANTVLGIAGYEFISVTGATLEAQSDVTDYQLETGDFLQNFIANKPFTISLEGTISELYFENPTDNGIITDVATTVRKAFSIANTVNLLADGVSTAISQLTNEDTPIENVAANALDVYTVVQNNLVSSTEVEKAVVFFLALRDAKQTIALTTPFGVYSNMAIEKVRFDYSNTANRSSKFSIQLKHVVVKKETASSKKTTIAQAQQFIEDEVKELKVGAKKIFDSALSLFS